MDKNYGYKHTKGFIIFFLFFIIMIITVAHGQTAENTTQNLIQNNNWTGASTINQAEMTTFKGTLGGPGPAYNVDTNTILFSFMPSTVSQTIAINTALSGQGISVNGYKYSWEVQNDYYNSSGYRGVLYGTVALRDSSDKVLHSKVYDYTYSNTGPTYLNFSGIEYFKNSYDVNSLGSLEVHWAGSSKNIAYGYYGARVQNIQVSLNYTKEAPPPPVLPKKTNNEIVVDAEPVVETIKELPVIVETKQEIVKSSTKESSQNVNSPSNRISLNSILNNIQANNRREQENISSVISTANQAAESAILLTEQTAIATVNLSVATSVKIANQSSLNSQNQSVNNFGNTDRDNLTFTNNFLSNRANPLTEIVENTTKVSDNTVEQKENKVNKSAQNNELSGNIDIASIAIQSPGFNQYVNLVIRDVAFYAPKEIYKGQKTVDNVRALRTLASDGLHQEMVNQQYLPR